MLLLQQAREQERQQSLLLTAMMFLSDASDVFDFLVLCFKNWYGL